MIRKQSKNILPLLAITALMLSVGLVNYTQISDSRVLNTKSVLSKSDEKKDENETENREEEKEQKKERERVEIKNEVKKEEKKEVKIEDGDRNEIETELEQEVNKFKLKIKTRTVAGKTVIETAGGEMEVENSPEDAVDSLIESEILDILTSFEAKTNDKNEVEFEIQGIETKKLLGLFNINLPKTLTVNAETGDVSSTNQNSWSRFLNFISR